MPVGAGDGGVAGVAVDVEVGKSVAVAVGSGVGAGVESMPGTDVEAGAGVDSDPHAASRTVRIIARTLRRRGVSHLVA